MPPLDIPTLLVLLGAMVAFAGLALMLHWRDNRQVPGLRILAASCLAGAVAGVLAASVESLPAFCSALLADFFMALCFGGLVEGMRRFYGSRRKVGWIAGLALAVSAVSAVLTWMAPHPQARSLFILVIAASCGVVMARIVWNGTEKGTRRGSGLLLSAAIFLALASACQIIVFIGAPREGFAPSAWLVIGLIVSLLVGLLGLFMVISERHLAMAEKLRQQAEASEQSKAGFLAVMSHEIRTPMNGVLGLSEILLGTGLDAKQRRLAISVRSSGRILLRILDEILDLSKIEAGRMEIERVGFKVRDLISEVRQLIREPAARKGLAVGSDIGTDVPLTVVGDPARLGQVLLNLLGNAVKFTERGSVTLRLSQIARGQLCFEVIDTGIGITPEGQKRLFSAFEQVESSTSRRFGGTGLGLAISKHLVELMGGRIEVESVVERGTKFSVLLPMPKAEGDTPETDEISLRQVFFDEIRPSDVAEKRDRKALRILVAEDDEISQMVAAGMLEGLGLGCDLVSDGAAALEALAREHYDLVFMDCHMPKLDGFEATAKLRASRELESGPRLPIIALTAGVMKDERERCFKVGMDDVVTKPVSTEQLAEVIERWLNLDLS